MIEHFRLTVHTRMGKKKQQYFLRSIPGLDNKWNSQVSETQTPKEPKSTYSGANENILVIH